MTHDAVNDFIGTLHDSLNTAIFDDGRPGFISFGSTGIGTTKVADGFGWEMVMPEGKIVSSESYSTIESAQDGLKAAVMAEIARLREMITPAAKVGMYAD